MISPYEFPPGPNLVTSFVESAKRFPDKTALVSGVARLTYSQVGALVTGMAEDLRRSGMKAGDRILVMLDNGIEFAVAIHAVMLVGGVFVPVSPLTRKEKLSYLLADTEAFGLITHSSLGSAWQPALTAAPARHAVWVVGGDQLANSRYRPWPKSSASTLYVEAANGNDLAAIIYTSGTTGRPKGVMLSHDNMRAAWRAVQAYLELRSDDVIGLALPMAFSYGLYHVLMGLGLGATVVIERMVAFPVRLLQVWTEERVSVFPGVPTLFASLLGQELGDFDLSALRIVTNAAAALPVPHLRRLLQAWPEVRFFAMYGLTECKRASYLPPAEVEIRPGSIGRGMPYQRHWLVDESGREVAAGGEGELVVAGPHVMCGYWRKPEETSKKLRTAPDGTPALFTGDIFRSDADGYLYFVSRTDDIIKSRGEKVSPVEVEHAICRLAGVVDAAVVGVADEALGEAVHAYVIVQPDTRLTEREVIRHCLAELESYMVPKQVFFVSELPVTDSGKVRRASLRVSNVD